MKKISSLVMPNSLAPGTYTYNNSTPHLHVIDTNTCIHVVKCHYRMSGYNNNNKQSVILNSHFWGTLVSLQLPI